VSIARSQYCVAYQHSTIGALTTMDPCRPTTTTTMNNNKNIWVTHCRRIWSHTNTLAYFTRSCAHERTCLSTVTLSTGWIMTLFTSLDTLPLGAVQCLWDRFLCSDNGWKVVHRCERVGVVCVCGCALVGDSQPRLHACTHSAARSSRAGACWLCSRGSKSS
jgi:hypothetical protein